MTTKHEICSMLLCSHNQNDTLRQGDFLFRNVTSYHLHQIFKYLISVARCQVLLIKIVLCDHGICQIKKYRVPFSGVRLSPLGTVATIGLLYQPQMTDDGDWSNRWNEDWQGKLKYLEKTCRSATLSTTNPTCPDLGSKRTATVGSQQLTTWVMALPRVPFNKVLVTLISH
jgi:hypothetical protein